MRGVLGVYVLRPRYGYSHGIVRAFLLPGPTIARLRRLVTGSKTAETRGEGLRDKEAAFPATESTRTSRDLAPDASSAAQAGGFFYVPRPAAGKRNFAAR